MPGDQKEICEAFTRMGIPADTVRAVGEIDAILQRWRRRISKRELGHKALRDLGIDLDLPQLDVLMAIRAFAGEFSDDMGDETMVSTIAMRLGIDPSRASRLVAELIRLGYAERSVSQSDARRTLLDLSPLGQGVVRVVRHYRFLVLGEFMHDWSSEEIALFVPLLERFSNWSDAHIDANTDATNTEIQALRREVAGYLRDAGKG
ncbi:MAG: MarR family transcriptional regulator [Paracoccaceae bacterium]